MEALENFIALLRKMLSAEAAVRQPAESFYDGVAVGDKTGLLIQTLLRSDLEIQILSFAAVLLRRVFVGHFQEAWKTFPAETKLFCQQSLLNAIQVQMQHRSVTRKIIDAVCALLSVILEEEDDISWPQLKEFLLACCNNAQPEAKEVVLQFLCTSYFIIVDITSLNNAQLKAVLLQCMQPSQPDSVRFEAVKVVNAILSSELDENADVTYLRDVIPDLLHVAKHAIDAQKDDTPLKCLIDIIASVPKFFKPFMEQIIQLALVTANNKDIEDEFRHICLELMVTVAEASPAMVRKQCKSVLPTVVSSLLYLMTSLEDEASWADSVDDDNEAEANDTSSIAETSLDRLCVALGGRTMMPLLSAALPAMLGSQHWQHRHAALMAIGAAAEGCGKQMRDILQTIVNSLLPFVNDAHPRVRYATINAIGQLSSDFQSEFQEKFHPVVVPALLVLAQQDPVAKVQKHAMAAMVNFFEDCDKPILSPYLPALVNVFGALLSTFASQNLAALSPMSRGVLEQAVTTLAVLADAAGNDFCEYYDRFIYGLKTLVLCCAAPQLRMLRGKLFECISLMGLAVGRDRFMQDASDVINALLQVQIDPTQLDGDDPQVGYIITAWTRICQLMGSEFKPFLPQVMPTLLKTAALKPDVTVLNDDNRQTYEDDPEWTVVSIMDKELAYRNTCLEDKINATNMLIVYAKELKEAFAEYVEEACRIVVPSLKFFFSEDIRELAAQALPYLLQCVVSRQDKTFITAMWDYIREDLLNAIRIEPSGSVKAEMFRALAECVETLGTGCLSGESITAVMKIMMELMTEHFERFEQRVRQRCDADEYDEDVEKELLEEEDDDSYLLCQLTAVVHALFKTYRADYFPFFEPLLPHLNKLMQPNRPAGDRCWALSAFIDLVEFAPAIATRYHQLFLTQIVDAARSDNIELRHNGCFGIGIMAQSGVDLFRQPCVDSLSTLIDICQADDARSEDNILATENAISAVAKICKFLLQPVAQSNSSDAAAVVARQHLQQLLPMLIGWLPIWEDTEEIPFIMDYICDLVESNNAALLGSNHANLPRIVQVLAESFRRDSLKPEWPVYRRLVNIVSHVKDNAEVFHACKSALNADQQNALSKLFASEAATNGHA